MNLVRSYSKEERSPKHCAGGCAKTDSHISQPFCQLIQIRIICFSESDQNSSVSGQWMIRPY